jgi:hypothetical protein
VPALLTRIFRRSETDPSTGLVPFGPDYKLSGDQLAIESGPLKGTTLRIERGVSKAKADFNFYETADSVSRVTNRRPSVAPDPVAHCHFDRDPETGTETLWGIFIRSEFRHQGLTALLIRLTFRELIATGRTRGFAVRKLMKVDTEGRSQAQPPGSSKPEAGNQPPSRVSLHNLGIGLVALRLGLRPEPDLERLLVPDNVKSVQALPPDPPSPPGLLIRLGTLPGLLVAALLDPGTGHPFVDAESYERFVSPRQLLRQALAGEALVGNIDYVLPRAAAEPLAARLANDHAELRRFAAALRRGTRN